MRRAALECSLTTVHFTLKCEKGGVRSREDSKCGGSPQIQEEWVLANERGSSAFQTVAAEGLPLVSEIAPLGRIPANPAQSLRLAPLQECGGPPDLLTHLVLN